MPAPPSQLVDRLDRLASHAPGGTVDAEELWNRGRRRHQRRAGAVLAGVAATGVLATAVTPIVLARVDRPVAASSQHLVLPDVLRAPGAWAPAFSETPHRLSAIGVGRRSGLVSSSATLWGVSAATGESRWLELPDAVPSAGASAQLSADGRRLAYWVTGKTSGEPVESGGTEDGTPVVGLAVMDLETGDVVRWDVDSEHGLSVRGLVWAGGTLWWQAGPLVRMGSGASSAELRVRTWDVETDERSEPQDTDERAAMYLSQPGHAPRGFVTLPRTFRLERVTEGAKPESLRMDLPPDAPSTAGLIDPEMAPDGVRVAALLVPEAAEWDGAAPQELLVGTAVDGTVTLEAVGGVRAQSVLGWRSPSDVVTSSPSRVDDSGVIRRAQVSVVDVTTGEHTELLEVVGALPVSVAADAWAAELVDAPDPPFVPDPRVVGAGALVVLVFGASLWRNLRRRRGHP